MKQFINLTSKESIGLDINIYKNALALKKDAILIANTRKSYSSASSLLILSSEEAIKSVLVRLHAEQYNIYKLKESSKFFRDHKIRHQMAQLIEMGSGLIESMMKYEEQKPTKVFKTKSWIGRLLNEVIDLRKASRPFFDSTKRVSELQAFNDLKNKGFYADYRDSLMLPQNEVTEAIYNRTLFLTERVFKFNKLVRILFHDKLENHVATQEIDKNKNMLRDFIDEAMKDFSFKELNKNMG